MDLVITLLMILAAILTAAAYNSYPPYGIGLLAFFVLMGIYATKMERSK